MTFLKKQNIDTFKSALLPLSFWPIKFDKFINLLKYLLYKEEFFIKLNRCIYFNYNTSVAWKNFNSKWPLCTIEEYHKLINLYLELVGFKKIIKDYILISHFSLNKSLNVSGDVIGYYTDFSFNIIFSESYEKKCDGDFYFTDNLLKLEIDSLYNEYFKIRFQDFTECFFYLFFYNLEKDKVLTFKDCLNDAYIKKVEKEALLYLKDYYKKINKELFSGGYSDSLINGVIYYTEKQYLNDISTLDFNNYYERHKKLFFNDCYLWINFLLEWQYRLIKDFSLLDAEVKVEYVGNCKYLESSLQ